MNQKSSYKEIMTYMYIISSQSSLTVVSSVLAVFAAALPTNVFVSIFLTLSPPEPRSVVKKRGGLKHHGLSGQLIQ